MTTTFVYHIVLAEEWRGAQEAGWYRALSLEAEGFLHFSQLSQVTQTANLYFRGHESLLLLKICVEKLKSPLRWDVSRGQQEFPHLYGPLNCDAVESTQIWTVGADARFAHPAQAQLSANATDNKEMP
jgi:uncharacterized protein (DUF952 family)